MSMKIKIARMRIKTKRRRTLKIVIKLREESKRKRARGSLREGIQRAMSDQLLFKIISKLTSLKGLNDLNR